MKRLCAALICLLLAACATEPTPFRTGRDVTPPFGCQEVRYRGGDC